MEEALYEISSLRPLSEWSLDPGAVPDETTILNFRCLLEAHGLAMRIFETVTCYLTSRGFRLSKGTIVDATTIAAPSSTKSASARRDPEMHQTKEGHQWHFGVMAHIGVDAETSLVQRVADTDAHVYVRTQAESLLH